MATTKITDLTAYTDPVNTDVLPIVDVTSDVTKKVSIADLMKNASLGTAAAPSIAFDGDPDSGLFSPGANQVAVATNGQGRLFVDASGNVGAGYSTPGNFAGGDLGATRPLVVGDGTASTNVNIFSDSTGYGHLAFSDGTSGTSAYAGLIQYYHPTDSMALYTAATERLRITSTGLVGIGTSAPADILHIGGSSNQQIRVNGSGAPIYIGSANSILNLAVNRRTSDGAIPDATKSAAYINLDGSGSSSEISFLTASAINTQPTVKAVIDGSGRVGIGTSAPGESIHTTGKLRVGDGGNYTVAAVQLGASNANGISYPGTNTLNFITNSTAALTIDASQRVGIGTANPSSLLEISSSSTPQFFISNTSNSISAGDSIGTIDYRVGSSNTVVARMAATADSANEDGAHIIFENRTGGGAFSEKARIDSSGRVGIGTSSVSSKLHVLNPSGGSGTTEVSTIERDNTGYFLKLYRNAGSGNVGGLIGADSVGTYFTGGHDTRDMLYIDRPNENIQFHTASTERMRISQNGQVQVSNALDSFLILSTASAGTSNYLLAGNNNAATAIFIYSNGNIQNTNNSYGAISDIKLKENIVDASSQWDDLKALQVRNYNFKEGQTHTQIGLVAQEVELVSPGLVSESPDRDEDGNDLGTVTKSVNYSVLYMKAVKALQEAIAKIETLEGMVAVNNITIDEQQHQLSTLAARLTALESA